MDRVAVLTPIVQQEVEDYARGGWWKARAYPIADPSRDTYAVVVIPDYPRQNPSGIVVMARIVDDFVIIEEDRTDRPLWEELARAGVPRQQIICAYLGETLPETEVHS